ncbi:MAG: cadmium-translocating P-type ATPase [Oscillospiraceae bacterium]|nr:cadmium-translocating P-type ATPase [Oscillospiraceae bacterium]
MELVYRLAGLDCPHCAAEIEEAVGKLPDITASAVNLMKQTLTVESVLPADALLPEIEAIVHENEPEVAVTCETAAQTLRISVFQLEGLDCPHCAAEIEEAVGKLPDITAAAVNLVKQTLTVESVLPADAFLPEIEAIVHEHEPEVAVKLLTAEAEKAAEQSETNETKIMALRLIGGGVLFAVGMVLSFCSAPTAAVLALLIPAYLILGYDVLGQALRNILRGRVFDEHFLMSVSTLGAFAVGEYPEAAAVMLFYQIGEFFQSLAVQRSRRSIAALLDIRPDTAEVERGGRTLTVPCGAVAVGETILVKPGARIPLDGTVLEGTSMLDTAALTGESVPRRVGAGDTVLSGSINQDSLLKIRTTKNFGESTASQIIDMVENAAARKAPAERFISVFARYYTPAVVLLAVLLATVPPLAFGGEWAVWIHRALVSLIVSCPCALVVSIPLTFFSGIGTASRRGILVKGSNALEILGNVQTVVFDKTGTLTVGEFAVSKCIPADGIDRTGLLARAAACEQYSTHPIARSILSAYDGAPENVKNVQEIAGQGLSAETSRGILLAGNARLMEANGIAYQPADAIGTKVYVAENGQYLGCIVIADSLRPESKSAVSDLRALGIENIRMLTGDDRTIGAEIAGELGLDSCEAELLPADKMRYLEQYETALPRRKKLAFLGDGINDAPALARADVGIAMGALGADAAIEAADVVLMTDDPKKVAEAVGIARHTRKIVIENIVFALGVKVLLLTLGALGLVGMWWAVFGDVGVTVLAVSNAMRRGGQRQNN